MRTLKILGICLLAMFMMSLSDCMEGTPNQLNNKTAQQEQQRVEANQSRLNSVQPAPKVDWSLERDNLSKRFLLMNDRGVIMYMYIFNYGIASPIGYYQVNKVSSVNSQLTNPEQIILTDDYDKGPNYGRSAHSVPSPAEDGSYGTNGDAIFGFTPDVIYIEHNMQYIVATAPLNFKDTGPNLGTIAVKDLEALQTLMNKLENK